MWQVVRCSIFLYAGDSCLVSQHKDTNNIEKTEDFWSICKWFVGNKLSLYFGKNKTKSILFTSKFRKTKNTET